MDYLHRSMLRWEPCPTPHPESMTPSSSVAAWHLVALGLALGCTVVAMTAYLSVSPAWLRGLLLGSGVLAAGRYVSMAVLAVNGSAGANWLVTHAWFGTSIGLTFPAAVALDQLVRHPAMTPQKVLRVYAPFFAADVLVLLFGRVQVALDPVAGVDVALLGLWNWLLVASQALFVLGVLWLGAALITKIPIRRIQLALAVLMGAYAALGLNVRPVLWSEMAACLALWFALDTARQQST